MFRCSDNRHFKRSTRIAFNGSRIRFDNQIFTDKAEVICAWKDYFSELWKSKLPSIQGIIKSLKKGKSPGPYGMVSEHILFSGGTLNLWLKHMFNSIIQCESIPSWFQFWVTTSVHKGKGKDPLNRGSYRGIIVTPVIAKLFEYVLVERFKPVLQDSGYPVFIKQLIKKVYLAKKPFLLPKRPSESFSGGWSGISDMHYSILKKDLILWNIGFCWNVCLMQAWMGKDGV